MGLSNRENCNVHLSTNTRMSFGAFFQLTYVGITQRMILRRYYAQCIPPAVDSLY